MYAVFWLFDMTIGGLPLSCWQVMQLALGATRETEARPALSKLSQELVGQRGLLFSNDGLRAMRERLADCVCADFARSGFVATRDVEVCCCCWDYHAGPSSVIRRC